MIIEELIKIQSSAELLANNKLVKLKLSDEKEIFIYPKSINKIDNLSSFIGRIGIEKYLFIAVQQNFELLKDFEGEIIYENKTVIKKCPLSNSNAAMIQNLFSFTKPVLLGISNSFGFGDRLGLANPAHVRSLERYSFNPVLAQQSIRELTRTNRKPEDVMSAAVWAVFQEGYKNGFGADADHLKTTDDIDIMIKAGFTMFTFDSSDFVINEADSLSLEKLSDYLAKINWERLNYTFDEMLHKYKSQSFNFAEGFVITPSSEDVLRAVIKYGNAIAHIKYLFDYMNENYSEYPTEIEISVDETELVTTPFEHLFMASELNRLGVKFISLAPRFIGEFEKGIDYKGDLEIFKK